MGVRILSIDGMGDTCLFDSTSGTAFGPVAPEDDLSEFLKWCAETGKDDLRKYSPGDLMTLWEEFSEGMSVVSDEE